MPRYDTAVLNGTVVVPYVGALRCDVGVRDGRIAALVDSIAAGDAGAVVDARGKLVLPGAVDSHFHIGIYRDLATDAQSETASALAGVVTTVLRYFRTDQNDLNKSGPYRTIFPEVVAATEAHAYTDFGYHIGVMTTEQLDEVDWLVGAQGVGSFKYYMFYKGLNLTSDSTRGSAYTMADTYDLGHLYLLMRQIAAAAIKYGAHGRVSLSLHCEQAELIRVFIEEVKRSGPGGLEGYHRSRPPLTEQLSIAEALVLTDATRCPVNLLHLSSAEDDPAPSGAHPRDCGRHRRQGQSVDPDGGRPRSALAGGAGRPHRHHRERSRVLRRGGQGRGPLESASGLRWHRPALPVSLFGGTPPARPRADTGRGAGERESRAGLRALPAQGRYRRRQRRRPGRARSEPRADRDARGSLLGPRLHAVRRDAGARLADPHAAERPDGVSGRGRAGQATRAVRQAPRRAARCG